MHILQYTFLNNFRKYWLLDNIIKNFFLMFTMVKAVQIKRTREIKVLEFVNSRYK